MLRRLTKNPGVVVRCAIGLALFGALIANSAAAQSSQAPSRTPQIAQPTPPPVTELPPVDVIGTSPLIGSGIDRNTVPAETQC